MVLGSAGQVGGAIVREIGVDNAITVDRHAAPTTRYALDLGHDLSASELDDLFAAAKPDVLINAAGMTWVDKCEADPDLAFRINYVGARDVAAAAHRFGARNVYFSTEYIFDGSAGPYSEQDPPAPISVYGWSKLAGESAVLAVDSRALIIRTTVVYGPESVGKNFAYQVASALASETAIRVPSDQVSTPTYNVDLARATVALVRKGISGIYNVVGPEMMDRATFARRLARALKANDKLIESLPSSALCQRAVRPLKGGLRTDRLRSVLPDLRLRMPEEAVAHWSTLTVGKPLPGWCRAVGVV